MISITLVNLFVLFRIGSVNGLCIGDLVEYFKNDHRVEHIIKIAKRLPDSHLYPDLPVCAIIVFVLYHVYVHIV